MKDKLREEFEGLKENRLELAIHDIIDADYEKCANPLYLEFLEHKLAIPNHETVEQWEKRTGETYPDDGAIWYQSTEDSKEWRLRTYDFYSGMVQQKPEWMQEILLKDYTPYVANHHGKPESTC